MKEETTQGKPLFTPSEMWDKDMRINDLERALKAIEAGCDANDKSTFIGWVKIRNIARKVLGMPLQLPIR